MKSKIDSYELSLAADSDIEEIFEYTEKEFGVRSLIKESHVVFNRILENSIRIVRILHKSRDLKSLLISKLARHSPLFRQAENRTSLKGGFT